MLTGAKSIVFDGVYSLADAGLTISAFFAARLIARGDDRRFQYGYWHIEPMLGFLNGSVLLIACAYALIDGVDTILMGGRSVRFGPGVAYAAVSAILCLGIHVVMRRQGRGLGSTLLDLDARAWLFSGLLNAALAAGFVLALGIEGTRGETLALYFDPAILILLALGMAPLPVRTLISAGREILQIAPRDLDARTSAIAAEIVKEIGHRQVYDFLQGRKPRATGAGLWGKRFSGGWPVGAIPGGMGGVRPRRGTREERAAWMSARTGGRGKRRCDWRYCRREWHERRKRGSRVAG